MANPEHLSILKQGVDAWNEWRKTRPDIQPDLSGADLRGPSLAGIHLKGTNLTGAMLNGVDLSRADFIGDPINRGVVGPEPGEFPSAKLDGANLAGAHLGGANLSFASCRAVHLEEAFLRASNLDRAYLVEANLTRADLVGAILIDARLSDAQLVGANLQWTDLTMASLIGADVSESMMGRTTLVDIDLSNVKGLDKVRHGSASFVGLDTIYRSGGNIPEVFLRGCGVPETMITFAQSLVGKAIEFYSTFISYSSKDDEFARRLHADLQARGVRVWFAPEDLKIGDRFRSSIDEAIRLYDKLMVVLSENSINSMWVESEVEAALDKERQQKRTVLFPIRLDDAVMEMSPQPAWAAEIRRTRHIGDFTKWKNHDEYRKAFERLLRDLQAESKAPGQ